jgi:hypothetical protein
LLKLPVFALRDPRAVSLGTLCLVIAEAEEEEVSLGSSVDMI